MWSGVNVCVDAGVESCVGDCACLGGGVCVADGDLMVCA
jgi:hypothetical protein